jgi:hypothetical protein
VALAVPLPGVLAETAVHDQERPLRLVLGQRLGGLPVDLHVDEHGLVPALAVAGEGPVRGEPQIRDRGPAGEVLQLGIRYEPAGQGDTVHVRHGDSPP